MYPKRRSKEGMVKAFGWNNVNRFFIQSNHGIHILNTGCSPHKNKKYLKIDQLPFFILILSVTQIYGFNMLFSEQK